MRPRIAEAIVVEGRYDRDTLLQAVDAVVVETNGFGVFSDGERLGLIRRLAAERGVILFTDSDSGGFLIRSHLQGQLPPERIKHAYIPDLPGKERRKRAPGKEGLLGVEGMTREIIVDALRAAGATFLEEGAREERSAELRRSDFVAAGLSGGPDASAKRQALINMLGLPSRISPAALYKLLSKTFTKDEFFQLLERL